MEIIQIILQNVISQPYIPALTPTLLIQYLKKKNRKYKSHTPKALLYQAPKLHSMMMHNYGTFKQHLRMCHKR